jgi:hypothetical protein
MKKRWLTFAESPQLCKGFMRATPKKGAQKAARDIHPQRGV